MFKVLLILLNLCAMFALAACGAGEQPPTAAPIPFTTPPSALIVTPVPTRVRTPLAATTTMPRLALTTTSAAIDALTKALKEKDAVNLDLLLADEVLMTSNANGEGGAVLFRADAARWLSQHWGTKRTLVKTQYVDHFVLLIVDTKDWAADTPLKKGTITFQLHRYNTQGQGDPLQGFWEIDTIIYQ